MMRSCESHLVYTTVKKFGVSKVVVYSLQYAVSSTLVFHSGHKFLTGCGSLPTVLLQLLHDVPLLGEKS